MRITMAKMYFWELEKSINVNNKDILVQKMVSKGLCYS